MHADGWTNVVTGLGTINDKRTAGALALDVVSDIEARDLWRGNDLARRIIEDKPRDALRRGYAIKTQDKEVAEKLLAILENLPGPSFVGKSARAVQVRARQYERAYGGGAIWPVINDSAGSLILPLDEKNMPRIERLKLFEPRQLHPFKRYDDANHAKFGEPEIYQVMPLGGSMPSTGNQFIHESRLIIYPGIRVSEEQLPGTREGWGDGVLTPVKSVLNDFELGFGAAAHLLQDFAQGVIKLKGLAEIIGVDGGQSDAEKRLAMMNWARSMLHALVMDSEDSFERVTTNLAQLPEMLDRFMYRLSSAADMPVTRLMGMSPAGMNATGESDTRAWYDVVEIDREHICPMTERLIQLAYLCHEWPGRGKEPDTWSIDWPILWQPSETEQSTARKTQADTDCAYIDRGVLSPEEVAIARFGGDTYSFETRIDFELRESLEPAAPKAVVEEPAPAPTIDPAALAAEQAPGANLAQYVE